MTKQVCDVCGREPARDIGSGALVDDVTEVEGTKLFISVYVDKATGSAGSFVDLCPTCLRKAVMAVLPKEQPNG